MLDNHTQNFTFNKVIDDCVLNEELIQTYKLHTGCEDTSNIFTDGTFAISLC